MKYQSFLGLLAMLMGCNVDVSIQPPATPIPTTQPTTQPSPTSTPSPTSVYTPLKPSADSKLIYVATNGSDSNPGTIDQPVLSIFKGITLLRKGFPDWLLLRRGDQFHQGFYSDPVGLSFHGSGRSALEPIVITSYSDPKAPSKVRPEIRTGTQNGFVTYGASNVALVGLNFHNTLRDPNSADFQSPVTSAPTGFRLGGNSLHWLIEDCVFDSYAQGLTLDAKGDQLYDFEDLKVRYNTVKNSYSNNRSQGLYAGNVNGLLIEGNIFDHNGWTEATAKTGTWNFMAQNHNLYLRHDNTGVIVRNNIIASGADCGLELRPGGVAQDNLLVQNTCGMTIGLVNGASVLKGGVTTEVSGNVILDGRADGVGSSCLEIGNIKQGSIHDNICAREVNDPKMYGYALQFETGNGVSNPTDSSGIQNTTVQHNLFYGWARGWLMQKELKGGATGNVGFANLLIQNNQFQALLSKEVQHEAPVDLKFETVQSNIYSAPGGQSAQVFQVGVSNAVGTTMDWVNLLKRLEPTAVYQAVVYPNPAEASVEAYNKYIGGVATYQAFLAEMEKQSSLDFQATRTTPVILKYLKTQFGR